MSHNLDRSLDEILANSKPVRRARGKAAPAGGIRKRSARVQQRNAAAAAAAPTTKAATNASNGASGRKGERNDTKILVSHLVRICSPFEISSCSACFFVHFTNSVYFSQPQDVSEQQIKVCRWKARRIFASPSKNQYQVVQNIGGKTRDNRADYERCWSDDIYPIRRLYLT